MGQSPDSSSYNADCEGLSFYQGNADFGETHPTPRIWCSEPKKVAEAGDILISVRAPVGAINVADERCCIGRGLAAVRPSGSDIGDAFLALILQSKRAYLDSMSTGSTFKAIGKKVLSSCEAPLYSHEAQSRIACQINGIDDCLRSSRKLLSTLDDLVKSQFVETFGDPKLNTKQWPLVKLGDAASTRLGKMLDAKKQTGLEARPYLANTDVQWFHFNLKNLKTMDFDSNDREEFALKEGDVLATEGGEVGRCAIWHCELGECYFQKAVHRIRCDSGVLLPVFLAWTFKMKSDRNLFDSYVSRSTIAHLTGEKLKKVPIQLPPISLQRQFADFVAQVDKLGFDSCGDAFSACRLLLVKGLAGGVQDGEGPSRRGSVQKDEGGK